MSGLAPDGGLYLPTSLPPKLILESLVDLPFQERMIRIMEDLLPSRIFDPIHLESIIDKVRMIISDLGYRSWNYAAARFRRYLIFYLERILLDHIHVQQFSTDCPLFFWLIFRQSGQSVEDMGKKTDNLWKIFEFFASTFCMYNFHVNQFQAKKRPYDFKKSILGL